jgi:hypothetical protein
VLDAIALIDISNHLVATGGGEVEVDVRRGVAAVAEEALEKQVVRQRVHRRDAEHVGDERVGRRAAALAADALAAGEAHEVPDDQEVVGQPDLIDDAQLVAELAQAVGRHRPVLGDQPGVRQRIQIAERGLAGRQAVGAVGGLRREGRRAAGGEVERDQVGAAAFGDGQRGARRLRQIGEERGQLDRGAVNRGVFPMRRFIRAVVVAATLLAALGAGWLVGLAGVAGAQGRAAPAQATATPGPTYWHYLPLVAHLAGDSSQPMTVTRPFRPNAWQAESAGLDYVAVVQGTAWLVTYDQGVPAVGQSATAGDRMYRANKAYLYFDTSVIPASATVLSATLTAANCRKVAAVPFTVEFYQTDALFPPAPADWLKYGGPVVGALPSAECGVWNAPLTATVTLDPASLVKGGLTAYALTTDRLRQALAPAWGTAERLAFDCFADDALLVRYVIPSP